MARWILEPGHTAAEFSVRHMMVTWVRGHFKNVSGVLAFDPKNPRSSSIEVTINAKELWSGDEDRDSHLRAEEFLDVENHPEIKFHGDSVDLVGGHDYQVKGTLTIRGIDREVVLNVTFLGQWGTPWLASTVGTSGLTGAQKWQMEV